MLTHVPVVAPLASELRVRCLLEWGFSTGTDNICPLFSALWRADLSLAHVFATELTHRTNHAQKACFNSLVGSLHALHHVPDVARFGRQAYNQS